MSETRPPISGEHVVVELGGRRILDGLTLEVGAGQVVCFIGGSGAGKSTFLRALLGLTPITGGSLRIFGEQMQGAGEARRRWVAARTGMLFQHGALLGSLSVLENVALPLLQQPGWEPALAREVARLRLAQVGLDGAAELRPGELSGGMQKRVALARAVVHEPALLLCDEPSAGLDPENVQGVDDLLLGLRDELGATVLVVTHEVSSIERIADRVVVLREGRLALDGSLAEVRGAGDPWTARFFGAPGDAPAPPSAASVLGLRLSAL